MPTESGLQHWAGGAGQSQQSSRAFTPHWLSLVFLPQTLPRGLHPRGLRKVPTVGVTPAASSQVTLHAFSIIAVGSPPQQSFLSWQMSLVRRQPLAGWQMFTPVSA